MSSRGQGRGVLRPPPTGCVPSKILDPGGVEPFGLPAGGSLKEIEAASTKRKAESARQNAGPLHSDSRLLAFQPHAAQAEQSTITGCPGFYEPRTVAHTIKHRGEVMVIDHVPAEVCNVCGDVLLTPETVRRIEALLKATPPPSRNVPLYEFA